MLEEEKKGKEERRCMVILISTMQDQAAFSSNFIPFSSQPGHISSPNFSVIQRKWLL